MNNTKKMNPLRFNLKKGNTDNFEHKYHCDNFNLTI